MFVLYSVNDIYKRSSALIRILEKSLSDTIPDNCQQSPGLFFHFFFHFFHFFQKEVVIGMNLFTYFSIMFTLPPPAPSCSTTAPATATGTTGTTSASTFGNPRSIFWLQDWGLGLGGREVSLRFFLR